MNFGIKKIAIPKESLLKLVDAIDADQDGFVTVGEAITLVKRYAKDAKASLKTSLIRRQH